MPTEEIPPSLQESILAALVFDERSGATIAAQVQPRHFDETYREIAERVLAYRRKYNRAPGRAHLDDLFARVLVDGRTPRLRRVLFGITELADGINGEYVVAQTQEFIRQQQLKSALIDANGRYEQGGEGLAQDVEAIFAGALRFRAQTLDAGTFLSDAKKGLKFFDQAEDGISLGIKELDNLGVALYPQKMMLYVGPKSSGKSWACVHVGKQGLLQRHKVLHVSLEMDEPEVIKRYYMSLFAAATRSDKFDRALLEFDDLDRLSGFRIRKMSPKWDFSQPGAKRELTRRLKSWGARLSRLVVKNFPSGSLTMSQLEGYLDFLELEHKFIPTLLILDYPDLMSQDAKNLRISLGRTFVDLRGLGQKRNLTLFVPTQGSRATVRNGKRVRSSDVTEDISKVFTADNVITFQRTEAEKERGLARLELAHARGMPDGAMVVITQSYWTGQYALSSALMQKAYWEQLNELEGDGEDDN